MSISARHKEHYSELRQLVERLAGRRLPGERELAARLHISRPLVRSLLDVLEGEGLVQRLHGSGTYAVDTQPARLNTVALLIDVELKLGDDPFFSLLVERVQSCLQEEGINCIIERIGETSVPRRLYDGAITLGQAGERVLRALATGGTPVLGLLLDTTVPPGVRASIFQLADREAGREAARYLLAADCHNLIFVGRRDLAASRERLAGVEDIIAEYASEDLSLQFVNCSLNYTAGLKAGQELPLLMTRPVGVIAANDWLAVGLRAGLAHHQLAVPAPHIVSFDGLPIAADPMLGITSLAVPVDALARDAIAELRRLHRSPVVVGRIVRYPLAWM